MIIGAVEDAVITTLQASALWTPGAHKVKAIDTLPTALTETELGARLRLSPALYWSFAGGRAVPEQIAHIEAMFGLYAISSNAAGELARRRGTGNEIGAYEMLEVAIPLIHNLVVPGVGSLELDDVSNLFAEQLDKMGLSLYVATFKVPMRFDPSATPPNLGLFQTFHADYDMDGRHHNTSPLPVTDPTKRDAEDLVHLPQ